MFKAYLIMYWRFHCIHVHTHMIDGHYFVFTPRACARDKVIGCVVVVVVVVVVSTKIAISRDVGI